MTESTQILILAIILVVGVVALTIGLIAILARLATRSELERERAARESLASETRTKMNEQEIVTRDRIGKVHARIDDLSGEIDAQGGKLDALLDASKRQDETNHLILTNLLGHRAQLPGDPPIVAAAVAIAPDPQPPHA